MRPHVLTIEAMGPYAQKVSINFDDLAHEGLFLIHGPTGSGKTSLLDALCFALYGEVPGHRGERGLKSDHAATDATPRVSLTFTAQGGLYQVVREPYHQTAKKRGSGTTTRHPTATLVRLDLGHHATIATRPTEVRDEIRRLVGLTPTQFQQVILLPQGQFEAVLRGKPETREGLLKTLFHTAGFEQLAAWLTDEAKARRALVVEENRRLAILAEEARRRGAELAGPGTDHPPEPPLFEPTDGGIPDQGGLDRLAERAKGALDAAEAALLAADAELQAHQATLTHSTSQAERWDRRRRATEERDHLQADTATIDSARETLRLAELAELIRPSLQEVTRRAQTVHTVEAASQHAQTRAEAARTALVRAIPAVTDLDLTVLPRPAAVADARGALAGEVATLEAHRATVAAATSARHAARQHRADEARALAGMAAATKELSELHPHLAALRAEITKATTAHDRLDGLSEAARSAEAGADATDRLVKIRSRLARAEADLLAGREAAVQARSTHLDLRARLLDGMAAVLAETLVAGEACQVCGSSDHPDPATSATVVSAEHVDTAERIALAAQAEVEARSLAVAKLQADEAGAMEAAGPAADPTIARAAATAANQARRIAVDQARQLPRLQAELVDLEARGGEMQTLVVAVTTASQQASVAASLQEQAAAEATNRLEAAVGPHVDLPAAIALLQSLDADLDALVQQATSCEAARQALSLAQDRADSDVAASPFAAADDARAALADPAIRQALHDQVGGHQIRFATVLDILGDPHLADLPPHRPDEDAARAAVVAAEQRKEAAVARRSQVHGAHARIDQLAHEHRELLAGLVPLESAAVLHEALANRCSGRAAPKVSLQRWVLATYLEAICEHANRRLATMTGRRYQLRVERDAAHGGAKAGLDLWVHDAHTGTVRPVATLSGGETFQASLALALGVADSVEARTGGVRLDALFVDEGFGSLDPESLQLAMDELDGLREGGRMVGLISHVGALRERIRLGIEISPTGQGSTVRVGHINAA